MLWVSFKRRGQAEEMVTMSAHPLWFPERREATAGGRVDSKGSF